MTSSTALEWESIGSTDMWANVKPFWLQYRISLTADRRKRLTTEWMGNATRVVGLYTEWEAAKAAAQQDFELRLSALLASGEPQVEGSRPYEALYEAAKAVARYRGEIAQVEARLNARQDYRFYMDPKDAALDEALQRCEDALYATPPQGQPASAPFVRCDGCDGHECINRCAYPTSRAAQPAEVAEKWTTVWYGSEPNKGCSIWTLVNSARGEIVTYVGPDHSHLETGRQICEAHNAGIASQAAEIERLKAERAEQWLARRDAEAKLDAAKAVIEKFQTDLELAAAALTGAREALSEAFDTLCELDERFMACGALHTAEDAYDSFYRGNVAEALDVIRAALTNPTTEDQTHGQ